MLNSRHSSHAGVIVTGGSGFLGQNVVKFLAGCGLSGVILDLRAPTDPGVARILQHGDWTFHHCDLSAPETFRDLSLPACPLYVMQLASKVHTSNAITPDERETY